MEKDVQKKIMKYLKERGCYTIKTVRSNRKGISDIIGCSPQGKFFAIEVKDIGKKNEVTQLQEIELNKVAQCNGIAIVADCIEDVKRVGL